MIKPTMVLSASLKPDRYSHIVIKRLRDNNHPVTPVGLKAGEIEGVAVDTFETAFAKADTHKNTIHTITLYLNSKRQPPYYEYILSLQPKRVVFNPGTENPEFYRILEENHIEYEVACTLVLLATNQY